MIDFVMILGIVGLLIYCAATYLPGLVSKSVVTPVPRTGAVAAIEPSVQPRWHKFDVLLELRKCLLEAGADEKQVATICEPASILLLGAKK